MALNLEFPQPMDNPNHEPARNGSAPGVERVDDALPMGRSSALTARITTGMVQDVGNLLAAVLAQVDLAQGSLEICDVVGVDRDLEDLRLAALRGIEMIRHMVSLNGGRSLELSTGGLLEIVSGAATRVRPALSTRSELILEHDESPAVRADAAAVEEIVMRLVRAADRAMPEGGRITVRTGVATVSRDDCRGRGWGVPGRYGLISVTDSGPRVSQETLDRSFTPLVAGESREGRHESLFITYALMKQHRGFVEVTSGPEGGCEVRLLFRLAAAGTLIPTARSRDVGRIPLLRGWVGLPEGSEPKL